MNVNPEFRDLGWRHPLWDYIRFYSVIQKDGKAATRNWLDQLRAGTFEIDAKHSVAIPEQQARLFARYLTIRETDMHVARAALRTEIEALAHCQSINATVTTIKTRSANHHQSSAALVAAVSKIASDFCKMKQLTLVTAPDRRAVWFSNNHLHVTARNLDGAIPSLDSPSIIWEIKEYWGTTGGGSKMSDAVYACALVGRELREFEERSKMDRIAHIVFLDGKGQWATRESDLRRFIDLFHQGIVDHLIIGREVQTDWLALLKEKLGGDGPEAQP